MPEVKHQVATLLEDAVYVLEMSREGRPRLEQAVVRDIAREILKIVWRVDSEL